MLINLNVGCVFVQCNAPLTIQGALAYGIRELQEINYPILWGGRLARPMDWAGETPTPQELIGYFLFGSP